VSFGRGLVQLGRKLRRSELAKEVLLVEEFTWLI